MNGPILFSLAAILLILFMATIRHSKRQPPRFGKVIDTDKQEYTFYEFS